MTCVSRKLCCRPFIGAFNCRSSHVSNCAKQNLGSRRQSIPLTRGNLERQRHGPARRRENREPALQGILHQRQRRLGPWPFDPLRQCLSQGRAQSNLNYANGAVSGSWEERTYNQSGTVTGKASSNRISLAITGGIEGSLSVSLGGSGNHSVSVSTAASALKGINISMSR